MRKGCAEQNLLALSFDSGEAHLAMHVLSCYFWQLVSFRRAKCMSLQCTEQVLRLKLLLLSNPEEGE